MKEQRKPIILPILLWSAAILFVLFLVWGIIIERIYGNPFKSEQEFNGLSYYDSQQYLEFEKGEVFVKAFSSYEFSGQCEITDFYYINNQHADTLFYGICPDVYGMTLDAGEHYDEIKSYIERVGTNRGDYLVPQKDDCHVVFYSMPVDSEDRRDMFVFAVGQDIPFLRFILITEYSDEEYTSPRYVVSSHSRMDWDLGLGRTGDGPMS